MKDALIQFWKDWWGLIVSGLLFLALLAFSPGGFQCSLRIDSHPSEKGE